MTLGGSTADTAVAHSAPPKLSRTLPESVNVVVVGYGLAGRYFHAYLIGKVPDLTLYGVVARRAEVRAEIEQREGCKTFASLEAALSDEAVDLIVLATPTRDHAGQAVQALDAGKHVVTDKPMATTHADAERMVAASQRTGRMLSVFHNRRWDGDYLTVKDLVERNALGRLKLVEATWRRPIRTKSWRGTVEAGGGRLNDLGSHLIDQALCLIGGLPETVYARIDGDDKTVEDVSLVTLGFAGGVTYVIDTTSPVLLSVKPRWFLMGTDGCVAQFGEDPQEAAMRAGDIDAAVFPPERFVRIRTADQAESILPTIPGRWRNYYENIADVLLRGAPLAVTADSAADVIAVIDAARRSAATGEVVRFGVTR